MKRKIIQIAYGDTKDGFLNVLALCNDGTLWELFKADWVKIPDIPQDKEENK